MPRTVGIDLGTSFSLIACIDKASGQPKCIPGPYGETLCPSIVSLDADGSIIVGGPARRRSVSRPDCAVYSVKALLGQGLDHIPDELKTTLRVDPESRDAVRIRLGEFSFTPQEMSAFVLRELKMWAEVFLGEPVGQAVISIPAYFDDAQRQAAQEAGMLAGMEILRLVNEPVAAALAYGLHERKCGHLAVYDLGRKFEISILRLLPDGDEEVYQVIASNGDAHLGGDDLDRALLDIAREEIRIRHGLDIGNDPPILQSLRTALLKAKHDLSFVDRASVEVPLPGRKLYVRDISRAEFDGLAQPIFERIMDRTRTALGDAKIGPDKIDEVVLVGGSTRIPLLRRMVAQFFGRRPCAGINPYEVVALGAAVQADILDSGTGVAEVEGWSSGGSNRQ
jgi:molecular chaperone DnaK